MIIIKGKKAIATMRQAGILLNKVFDSIAPLMRENVTSLSVEQTLVELLQKHELKGESQGYKGYQFVSCISFNDEVVHGMPSTHKVFRSGDVVKIDVCASWRGYCADMARCFVIGVPTEKVQHFVTTAHRALDAGIAQAIVGNRLSDVSSAIQREVEHHGYSVVRDFAGHGIGKSMHEDPEILNYGEPGQGPVLRAGMTLAIEPMIAMGDYHVYVADDGWTVKTKDMSIAAHVEDTVLITEQGPEIFTRAG